MTNAEIDFIMDSIELTVTHFQDWMLDYTYNPVSNEYSYKESKLKEQYQVKDWFTFSKWE